MQRGAPDRQFYFINSRPCDHTKLAKMVNQVYHGYNRNQFPLVCLNIFTKRDSVDVNITPDKRQIFLTHEKYLLELVKKSLEKMFEDAPATMPVNNFLVSSNKFSSTERETEVPRKKVFDISQLKRSFSKSFSSTGPSGKENAKKQRTMEGFVQMDAAGERRKTSEVLEKQNEDLNPKIEEQELQAEEDDSGVATNANVEVVGESESIVDSSKGLKIQFDDFQTICSDVENKSNKTEVDEPDHSGIKDSQSPEKKTGIIMDLNKFSKSAKTDHNHQKDLEIKGEEKHLNHSSEKVSMFIEEEIVETDQEPEVDDDENLEIPKIKIDVAFDMSKLRDSLQSGGGETSQDNQKLRFKAQISPSDNTSAENELRKQLQKSDFKDFKVFGQFNLGFIIAGLDTDLFIIDQHATDEKYNFETLQKTTVIESQKMVLPQKLELTSVNESILMENLEMFEKNGFKFDINTEAPPTQRIKLVSLPMSRNWTFGKDDIDELIFMLAEGGASSETLRPSRVRAMFASRACRSSVMIGRALSNSDMRRIVTHMGQIEQPWNCPHGRPTIRHLINTDMLR